MKHPVITLLSDFGEQDSYVAEMKGVLLSFCPRARLVDITHQIPPYDVETGARILRRTFGFFPKGSVHLCVVDPGVGSSRKALVIRHAGYYFIGPDNGLFSMIAEEKLPQQIHVIRKTAGDGIAPTFHGRDVFAPAAGKIANGEKYQEWCSPTRSLLRLPDLWPQQNRQGKWEGKIIYIDRFGNAATNLQASLIREMKKPVLISGSRKIADFINTFSEGKPGRPAVLSNGEKMLEIVVPEQSAAQKLHLFKGDRVSLAEG